MQNDVNKKVTPNKLYDSYFVNDKLDLEIHNSKKDDYLKFMAQREYVHDENMFMNPNLYDKKQNKSIDVQLNKK